MRSDTPKKKPPIIASHEVLFVQYKDYVTDIVDSDSCYSSYYEHTDGFLQHGHFDFRSLGLHPILESTSRLGRDRVPLEKDKVGVILFFKFLKSGIILAEERLRRYSCASISHSG